MSRNRFIVALMLVVLVSLLTPLTVWAAARDAQIELPPLTPELLAGIAGVALSLALSYIPGLNSRYAGLSEDVKKFIMLLLLAAVSLGVFGVSCAPLLGLVFVECSSGGVVQVLTVFIAALIANQGVHRVSPEVAAVRAAKANPFRH